MMWAFIVNDALLAVVIPVGVAFLVMAGVAVLVYRMVRHG